MRTITVSKILLIALIVLLLPVQKAEAIQATPTPIVVASIETDNRALALESVFEKHNSPLKGYGKDFVDTADKYNIDWKLLPAIAGLESSFGNAQRAGSYNSYGWGGGRIYFNSVEDGIETVLSALRNKYMSKGATTVESIAPIYSESPTWAPRINRFMDEIESEYDKLGMHKLTLTI